MWRSAAQRVIFMALVPGCLAQDPGDDLMSMLANSECASACIESKVSNVDASCVGDSLDILAKSLMAHQQHMEDELPSKVMARVFRSSNRLVSKLEKKVASVSTTLYDDSTRRAVNARHLRRGDIMNKETALKEAASTSESTIKYFSSGAFTKLDDSDTIKFAALVEGYESYKGLTCPMVVATVKFANAFTKAFKGCPKCKNSKTCSKSTQMHYKSEYAKMQLLKEVIDEYTIGIK